MSVCTRLLHFAHTGGTALQRLLSRFAIERPRFRQSVSSLLTGWGRGIARRWRGDVKASESCGRATNRRIVPAGIGPAECKGGGRVLSPDGAQVGMTARSGEDVKHAGGDDGEQVRGVLELDPCEEESSHPVGWKLASAWELIDMSGSVAVEGFDRYAHEAYDELMVGPTGPDSGDTRALRGGRRDQCARHARVHARQLLPSDPQEDVIGIEIVRAYRSAWPR